MVCTALLATMTANAFIRVLTAADAPAYKTLHDTVLHSAPEAFVSDLASALARPAQAYVPRFGSIASGRFFLGAFCSDAAAPMLGCVGCERALYPQQRHSGELVGLMVAPPAQRQGLGWALLLQCLALAAQVPGLEQLQLSVQAGNAHAIRLYERAGFTAWGREPRALRVGCAYHDKVHMMRLLHPTGP